MNLREAAKRLLQAINAALPYAPHRGEFDVVADFADDLRAALAEPTCKDALQVEPVAWMDIAEDGTRLSVRMWSDGNRGEVPLYTAPPQRKQQEPVQVRGLPQRYVPRSPIKPVAWIDNSGHPRHVRHLQSATEHRLYGPLRPLFAAPPQRKPLNDEEIDGLELPPSGTATVRDFVRIVERAHGIGGQDE